MSRKGITPVVATMLLLLIAVAAVGSASVFLQDTLTDVQDGLEGQVEHEERVDSTDIRIEFAYNQTDYILVDVVNSGTETLEIEEDGNKLWNLYIDNRPETWEYVDDAQGGDVLLNPEDTITLNTTEEFPPEEESKEISLNAPYDTSDSYVCFNEGGNNC